MHFSTYDQQSLLGLTLVYNIVLMRTHQFLCLRAKERVDTDDEGSGGAQDLQQFPRQDGNVGEAETGEKKEI